MEAVAVVVMGVSGCGKSTVGSLLARRVGADLVDADDLHPAGNVAKMRAGVPLDDADRAPWLARLREELCRPRATAATPPGGGAGGAVAVVLACSALKKAYRQVLVGSTPPQQPPRVLFVFLNPPRAELERRVAARAAGGHFMPPALLGSQLRDLEPPSETDEPLLLEVTAEASAAAVVDEVVRRLAEILRRPPLARH